MRTLIERLPLLIGIVSGLAAIVLSVVAPEKYLIISLFSVISVLMSAWYVLVISRKRRTSIGRKVIHYRLNSLLTVLLVFFIIVILNLIARQFYFRADLTSSKRYSLSEITKRVLQQVNEPLKVLYFGTSNSREFKKVKYLLEAYRYENRKLTYDMYDLDSVPLLAKRYNIREYGSFVVLKGEKSYHSKGNNEQTLTNLIITSLRKKRIKVYFLQGHGEKPLSADTRSGYGKLLELLRQSGFDTAPLDLTQTGTVPPDADVLVIASPAKELSDDDYRMLSFYRMSGGKFIVLVDSAQQLYPFLSELLIRISSYPVYDSLHVAGIGPSAPLVQEYLDNPITSELGQSTFFPGVYQVDYLGSSENADFYEIVKSSRDSWFEKNGDGIKQKEEEEGYQRLGAALVPKKELYRVVIFGDSDFVSNAYISVGGNGELFLRTINWLVGEGSLTSIASNPSDVIPLFITQRQIRAIRLFAPVGVPIAIFIAGLIVWIRRRSL